MPRALGLFSGGLDSMLAVCVLREQGVEVVALTFTTPFFGAGRARKSAEVLGVPLVVRDITDAHLEVLLAPPHGWGSGMNPCIDCHALMLRVAAEMMVEQGFDFVFTGEVLGQRPMSQNRGSLNLVAKLSGLSDRLLRPLSAGLLEPTLPEREGLVDRKRLPAISGRGRKPQMELARRFGLTDYPAPAGGCLLTDPIFSRRLKGVIAEHGGSLPLRWVELLKVGRQLRLAEGVRLVVGRREPENDRLEALFRPEEGDWLLTAEGWPAPHGLLAGAGPEPAPGLLEQAAVICLSYSDAPEDIEGEVVAEGPKGRLTLTVRSRPRSEFRGIMV